jgi:hypothetical protein
MRKKLSFTTDLFKDKIVPDFIKTHSLFKNPIKFQKVFPSIGLANFKEKANIAKCFSDIKKEGGYVFNLISAMNQIASSAKDAVYNQADKIQYILPSTAREENKAKLVELYNLGNIITDIVSCTDPYSKQVLDETIIVAKDRIDLRLMQDVGDNGDKKSLLKKGTSLFKIFGRILNRIH